MLMISSAAIFAVLGYKLYKTYINNHISPKATDYNDYIPILTTSAPGKIILCGEHAVVYGITAISTAIDKKTSITIYEPKTLQNETNSKIILKLSFAELIWNINDLFNIYSNYNALNVDIITREYNNIHSAIKPKIVFTVHRDEFENNSLYKMSKWDHQIVCCLSSLLFQPEFIQLWSNKRFLQSGVLIDVKSNIPIGAGLGSSAAWSTSLSAAVYYYYQYVVVQQRQNKVKLFVFYVFLYSGI